MSNATGFKGFRTVDNLSSWSGSKSKKMKKEFFRLYDKFHLYQRWNRQYGKFHRSLGSIRRVELRSLSFYLAWFHHFFPPIVSCVSTYAQHVGARFDFAEMLSLDIGFFSLYMILWHDISPPFSDCVYVVRCTLCCVWNEKCEKSFQAKSSAFDTMRAAIYSCSWDRT